jgi:MFS family permease
VTATRLLLLFGLVAGFGDLTYEGARSVNGPWLEHLGATATAVALVAGLGEALGHGLRLLFGRLADRTGAYWTLTAVGYSVNLVAIPGLALCGRWEAAAVLVLAERVGKAIRGPARSVLVADASKHVGLGRGFAIEEVLDQLGAVGGPLLVAAAAAKAGGAPAGYGAGFLLLAVPAAGALVTLALARRASLRLEADEAAKAATPAAAIPASAPAPEVDPAAWRRFVVGGALLGAATADWAFVAVHLGRGPKLDPGWIAPLYALAMAADGAGAWVLGDWFDRRGPQVLAVAGVGAALAAPLLFLGGPAAAVLGAVLWGVTLGAQESTLKAAVGSLVPKARRGAAYGAFATVYGLSWSAGSAAFGLLYTRSLPALVVLAVGLGLAGAALLATVRAPRSR